MWEVIRIYFLHENSCTDEEKREKMRKKMKRSESSGQTKINKIQFRMKITIFFIAVWCVSLQILHASLLILMALFSSFLVYDIIIVTVISSHMC